MDSWRESESTHLSLHIFYFWNFDMNICHILTYSYENGGTSKFVYEMAKCQLNRGDQVKILSTNVAGHADYPVPEGVELIKFEPNATTRLIPLYSKDLRDYVREHQDEIDVFHLHCLWNYGELLMHRENLHHKTVVTIHGSLHEYTFGGLAYYKRLGFSKWFQKDFLKKIKVIHVNHKGEEEDVKRYLGYIPDQTEIIPNGMDGSLFYDVSAKKRARKNLLYMGRLHHKKGFDILMPAIKLVAKKHPDVKLLIAGPDEGMLTFIQNYIRDNQLENNVDILGTVMGEEKENLLKNSGIFVLPTHSEGFSLAVMEALLYGLPLVVSDQTGLSPMLENYEAAVVTNLNAENYAAALIKVLEDDRLFEQLPKNGKKLIDEKLDQSIICKEFQERVYSKF